MSIQHINVLTDVFLITCIVQRGRAKAVLKAAQDAGAQGATIHYGHGFGVQELLGVLSVAINTEKEIINILVPSDLRDMIFEKMSIAGHMDTPGMGMIYSTRVEKAATYIPQHILDAIAESEAAKKHA
ncbi:P-II family nitrogen regulator [Ghiorsea bivora]|uniref:P-II family nitrogen regulator n=1 Tax=Ghiorsea bivora TaxID=1485545 RepID=UPI0005716C53|nr:P-II family nitrogen regulator [Ghiorsea bivora]